MTPEYCLAGDRHQCPDRRRIFDRRTYEPEVDTAGELRSDRCLIHVCDVRTARSIPLTVVTLIAIYKRSKSALLILGTLAGFIQLLDAGVGLLQHHLGKVIGPLVIVLLQFFAVYRLSWPARSGVE